MVKETHIVKELIQWLQNKYKESNLHIESEVKSEFDEFSISSDLVAVQSKSNVLHAYEIKSYITEKTTQSIIWKLNSCYANYKWLVAPQDSYLQLYRAKRELFKRYGIGVITFDTIRPVIAFKVKMKAKYHEGNFIEYWPSVKRSWRSK